MKTSTENSQVLTALMQAKNSIGKIAKGASNPFFKSKYADLPSILDAVQPIMEEHRLAMFQPVKGDKVYLTFVHSSGEWAEFEGTQVVPGKDNDPQAYGSAITYARRYTISSVLCINADKDDDAEKAMSRSKYKDIKNQLSPGTDLFNRAAKAIRENRTTIDEVERLYKLTASDREALLTQANNNQ